VTTRLLRRTKAGFERRRETSAIREVENRKKTTTDLSREFVLVNSMIQKIWEKKTKIITVFERNGQKIQIFLKPGGSDVKEGLLNLLKPTGFVRQQV